MRPRGTPALRRGHLLGRPMQYRINLGFRLPGTRRGPGKLHPRLTDAIAVAIHLRSEACALQL